MNAILDGSVYITGRRSDGMREKILYVCEVCRTEYADKEAATLCENSHIPLKGMKIIGAKFHPVRMNARSQVWPTRITLQAFDGSTRVYST